MNITYLLGAGASYNAMPTVANFPDKMIEMAYFFEKYDYNHDNLEPNFTDLSSLNNFKTMFTRLLRELAHNSKEYTTPDTYAKYLHLNNNKKEIIGLKTTLSLFIYLSYFVEQKQTITVRLPNQEPADYQIKKSDNSLDYRYIPLLVSLLEGDSFGVVRIPKHVKFISWNYDLQLEIALMKLFNEVDFNTSLEFNKAYPFNFESQPKIIHLNGVAGFNLDDRQGILKQFDGAHNYGLNDNLSKAFEKIFSHFQKDLAKNYFKLESSITFAWEKTAYSINALTYAREILNQTDLLVIIGYSFPFFNRDIDRQIMGFLKPSAKIYYQDPNANENNLKKQFKIQNEIEPWTATNQFFIPHEF